MSVSFLRCRKRHSDLLLATQRGCRPRKPGGPPPLHPGWLGVQVGPAPASPGASMPGRLPRCHRCNPAAHAEHSVLALSAWNSLQPCLGRAPGPKFLVGDVHSICDNSSGRAPRGWLPWCISSSDNREVSPLSLLESWPGLGGGLEGEAKSRLGHLGQEGSALEGRELPRLT